MQREDLDKIGKIKKIYVYPKRDGKRVVYFECEKKDVDFLNKVFTEVNTIIEVVPIQNEYLIYFSFPHLHYKKDLFVYQRELESEDYRSLRMNEFEFITCAWLDDGRSLTSYPDKHVPYLHPTSKLD